MLWSANGIADGVGGALSVEPTSQTVRTNGNGIKTGVLCRRGKREGGEEPVNKDQIRSGDGRWKGRRGVGRLNPPRETKTKGRNGDRDREVREEVRNRRKALARKRRRRGRAERRPLRQRERRNRARARGRES